MKFSTKLNKNIMIGAAILATYAKQTKKDSIDLLIPFVKYSLKEKYQIGEKVSASEICDYMKDNFAFTNLPIVIVEKTLNRLSKHGECLRRNNHEYFFDKPVDDEHSKIRDKKLQANQLIDSIIKKLTSYLNENGYKKHTEEEARQNLFSFLERYGLEAYSDELESTLIPKTDNTDRSISSFILQEYKANTPEFDNLTELVIGTFLSKAIYMQEGDSKVFETKMKDIVFILDAPLMLSILGLKTEGENKIAKEFLQLIPPQVKLRYLPQNLNELESIIISYKNQKKVGHHLYQTLEYFDEKRSSISDIDSFYIQIEKKLRDLKITEYTESIPSNQDFYIDEQGLSDLLKKKIPAYQNKEKALETDVTTIATINRVRRGRHAATLEDCKAIFVTNNLNLVNHTNKFMGISQNIGCAKTVIDITVLLWLKSGNRTNQVPKEILVANALTITETITEAFMDGVKKKVKEFQNDENFNDETVRLLLEEIYIQRELADKCNGIPELLTATDIHDTLNKYDHGILEEAKLANDSLSNELKTVKKEKEESEQRNNELIQKIKDNAKIKATKRAKIAYVSVLITLTVVLLTVTALGIYCTVAAYFDDNSISWLGIVLLTISIYSIVDTGFPQLRHVNKFAKYCSKKVYDHVYYRNIEILNK